LLGGALFKNAIVRPPSLRFAEGLTTAGLGPPLLEAALAQHRRYCEALSRCGVTVTQLEPDPRHPDATFVEDTAVLTERGAILARPGAPSRRGEVAGIRTALAAFYRSVRAITPPGTLEGGDVCQVGDHFFIGISGRTNHHGARQLASFLEEHGYTSTCVGLRGVRGLLHLKSGMAWLGDHRLVLVEALAGWASFQGHEIVPVERDERYAANCVRVNDHVLLAAGHPRLGAALRDRGYSVVELEMSEFQRMDGGLSCLSLRF
jgi:dimethylargininase